MISILDNSFFSDLTIKLENKSISASSGELI